MRGSSCFRQDWLALLILALLCNLGLALVAETASAGEGQRLRVDFECSGGFVNLQLRYRADTSELPPPTASQLTELVNASGLLWLSQSDIPERPTPPDVISYRIDIERNGKRKSFVMNDVTAPAAAGPLLGFLRKLALEAGGARGWTPQ